MLQLLKHPEIDQLIQLALNEDGVSNDLTALATEFKKNIRQKTRATIIAKAEITAAGTPIVEKIINLPQYQGRLKLHRMANEGDHLSKNSPWLILEGDSILLLSLERTILNFLMRMSGIATHTRQACQLIKNTNCKILHTRKTAPGHRRTDIYAALIGGAHPHRRSLDDAILVKENHLRIVQTFGDLREGIAAYRDQAKFVEIEVTDFIELKHALLAKPDRIMLDNFSVENIEKAVTLFGSSVEFEASGGITLQNLAQYAATGVDYISMGALTHSALSSDLSMLFDFNS